MSRYRRHVLDKIFFFLFALLLLVQLKRGSGNYFVLLIMAPYKAMLFESFPVTTTYFDVSKRRQGKHTHFYARKANTRFRAIFSYSENTFLAPSCVAVAYFVRTNSRSNPKQFLFRRASSGGTVDESVHSTERSESA